MIINIKNKIIQKRICILLLLLLVLLITGCSDSDSDLTKQNVKGTRIVTDCAGREVTLPPAEEIQRVACLYAFTGHVTALVGGQDKIVSVVNGLKRDILFTTMFPAILEANVPYTEGYINIEELIKAKPDVAFVRFTTAANEGEMNKLKSAGIPAVVIDCNNMEEQILAISVAGEVLGGKSIKTAENYKKFYLDSIELAKKKTDNLSEDERIRLYHSVNEAVRTDEKGGLCDDWTRTVGVINVSTDKELNIMESKAFASLEQIYLWDPEMIIVNEPGVGEYMLTDQKWAELTAVKERKIYQMPIGISRWGHPGSLETPLAILWLGKTAYPELFSDVDLYKETKNFYKVFFNYELTDEDVDRMISGEGMRLEKNGK